MFKSVRQDDFIFTFTFTLDKVFYQLFQLPSRIFDREIASLAPLFSTNTLETVALRYFDTSEATVGNHKAARREDTEGFNRDLLTDYRNNHHNRKVII